MRSKMLPFIATGAVLATAATVGGVALAAGSHHGTPVIRRAPARPPATSLQHGVCLVPGSTVGDGAAAHGLVWVRPKPTSVVTIWLPGLNSHRCHARRIVGGQHRAERLAAAIEQAPRVPNGPYACPSDDATRVQIYLTYAAGGDEYVNVSLSGCRWLNAPGRSSRWVRSALEKALQPLAPVPWQRYLS